MTVFGIYLVLDEKLDTLDGSGSGLGDGGGNTTHYWHCKHRPVESRLSHVESVIFGHGAAE